MTDCCMETTRLDRADRVLRGAELTISDMVACATYRLVAWAASTHQGWTERRRARAALDALERLDDRQLAVIGLSRADLSVAAQAMAAAKRNRAVAATGLPS